MTDPRHCLVILETQVHPEHGYVPSLVVEGEPGHSPLIGRGEFSQPWYWGSDLARAKAICADVNARMFGLSDAEALDIVLSSMAAANRAETVEATHRVRLAAALGRRPDPADAMRAERGDGR